MKQSIAKTLLVLLVLTLLLSVLPPSGVTAEEMPLHTDLEGKTISILGDSISTFAGVSNDPAVNATLAGSAIFYQDDTLGVSREDTWWQQTADRLGMEVLVNNSWSGSHTWKTSAGTVGAYIDRCVQLHNNEGVDPDIIAVYLGTNDFGGSLYELGKASELEYETLITESESGYQYAQPKNVSEAYAIMLHKMTVRYPNAEIYCMIPLPRFDPALAPLAEDFNASLKAIAAHFGAYVADLYGRSGIQADRNFYHWLPDGIHPGTAGMDAITGCLVSSILENSRHVTKNVYPVEYLLDNVTIDQGLAYAALENAPFHCTMTGPLGYGFSVKVTMDGQDVTDICYASAEIRIDCVTGPIQIQVSPALPGKANEEYRWSFDGKELVSAADGSANPLTRLDGMIAGNFHVDSRYQLEQPIVLRHDRPWALEWRSISIWGSKIGGVMLLSTASSALTQDSLHLYHADGTNFLALGYYDGALFHNYGVDLSGSGLDLPAEHTFRLENRLAEDGSNMVYLLIDGEDKGPMNQYYQGSASTGTISNWLNGKDLIFSYMGSKEYPITLHNISYFHASQCVHHFSNWDSSDDGQHSRVCQFCGAKEQHAHTWDEGIVIQHPTCAEAGSTQLTCSVCSTTKIETLEQLPDHTYDHDCDAQCNICGQERSITHSYSRKWFQDQENHWHKCKRCGHIKDASAHTPGPEAKEENPQICLDCGYVLSPALDHTHKWQDRPSFDQSSHWYTCSGCEEIQGQSPHSFDHGCDQSCNDCGYTRSTSHIPGPEATETEDQVCTECGEILAPALGPAPTEPTAPAPSAPSVPTQPPATEPSADPPSGDSPPRQSNTIQIILIAIASAALGGGAALILTKKKT